jgi:hypothetical protein
MVLSPTIYDSLGGWGCLSLALLLLRSRFFAFGPLQFFERFLVLMLNLLLHLAHDAGVVAGGFEIG